MSAAPDYMPGDPASHVLGKPEEKPARVHRLPPPKPGPTEQSILADIKLRKAQLEGVPEEAARLEDALKRLKGI